MSIPEETHIGTLKKKNRKQISELEQFKTLAHEKLTKHEALTKSDSSSSGKINRREGKVSNWLFSLPSMVIAMSN